MRRPALHAVPVVPARRAVARPVRARAAVAALALLALTGCSGGGSADAASPRTTYEADVPVLVPGAPGESAQVLAPGETGSVADPDAYVEADTRFMTDMISHHAQALEMAALAPERAEDARVRALAERIAAGQRPEILAMAAWLRAHQLPVPAVAAAIESGEPGQEAHAGHDGHEGMPGMASAEELAALEAARGTEFDRLFLELMTRHHEGALVMADDALDARHVLVREMIDDVVAGQSVEIGRMQQVLADLR